MSRSVAGLLALLALLAALPFFVGPYLLSVLTLVLFLAYTGQAWNVMMGFAGQLSLGHSLYVGVGACIALVILSGLAIWKPVQFYPLCFLLGGYELARHVHFVAMAGIAGFIVVHLALVAIVPSTLLPMIIGRSSHKTGDV